MKGETHMKKVLCGLLTAVSMVSSADTAQSGSWLSDVLAKPILPARLAWSSYDRVLCDVAAGDVSADRAWLSLKSRSEYDAYRKKMHDGYVKAIGSFAKRTPLNPKTVRQVERDGYRVEYVVFESHPGVYVTANLYLPAVGDAKFKPPYRAFLVSCGHSFEGKGDLAYSRMGAMAARNGFACLVYDPIAQGERIQKPSTMNVFGHYRLGLLASILGKSMALFRIWDGVRAMDYLDTRSDIIHDGYGVMGNSGGGTMTSLIAAYDPRVVAAAPSCYISTVSDVFADKGPQDCEQVIFGQLAIGLNHASFALMGGNAFRIHACHGDFFPFRGTLRTLDVITNTAANCGLDAARYGMSDFQGPHGWREGARNSSLLWMRRHLARQKDVPETDLVELRGKDVGFSYRKVDCGVGGSSNHFVTASGDVSKEPGFRSVYDILKDEAGNLAKTRKKLSGAELARAVVECAGIRQPEESGIVARKYSSFTTNSVEVTRLGFFRPDGVVLPAVLCRPAKETSRPVLALDTCKRENRSETVSKALADGSAVLVIDVFGTGEIGEPRRPFYGSKMNDEGIAAMLYSLGRSLTGERAGDILAACSYMKKLTGKVPEIRSGERMVIASVHAYAARRDLVAGVKFDKAPLTWTEAIENAVGFYAYAYIVNGALQKYDWTDLL